MERKGKGMQQESWREANMQVSKREKTNRKKERKGE